MTCGLTLYSRMRIQVQSSMRVSGRTAQTNKKENYISQRQEKKKKSRRIIIPILAPDTVGLRLVMCHRKIGKANHLHAAPDSKQSPRRRLETHSLWTQESGAGEKEVFKRLSAHNSPLRAKKMWFCPRPLHNN